MAKRRISKGERYVRSLRIRFIGEVSDRQLAEAFRVLARKVIDRLGWPLPPIDKSPESAALSAAIRSALLRKRKRLRR